MARTRNGADDRGAVAIIVAVGIVGLLLLVGLVVDFGQVFAARARLQSAVDAAALAGAQEFCLPPAQGWTTTNDQESDARAAAVDYAQRNGGLSIDPDSLAIQTGGTSYLTIAASEPVTLFFGALADDTDSLGNAAVGAIATASRECTISFQFVADETVQFNGAHSEAGNWYAGECFDGQNNVFDTIAVGSDENHMCADPRINGDPPPIVRAEAEQKLYRVVDINASNAMQASSMGVYVAPGSEDPWRTGSPVVIGPCADVTWRDKDPVVCNGDLDGVDKVPSGRVEADVIMASGDIDLTNNVEYTGRLIYSRDGDITLLNGVPAGTIIYAPSGTVRFNGSGTRNYGMVFAQDILFNGGDQDAGPGVNLYAPGRIALAR